MLASSDNGVIRAFNARAKALGWSFQCAPAISFERAELNTALAVWREKAGGRRMPGRADLTARVLKFCLTQMSLIERVADGGAPRYRVRLHGSALARYAGDCTGKFLDEVVQGDRLESFRSLYDTLLALEAPLRVVSQYQAPEIDYLTGETLLAPLSGPPLILSVTYAKPRSEIAGGIDALRLGPQA
ncbi:MAG: PAS domain-containing protein [Rhizomicrobium sp.]